MTPTCILAVLLALAEPAAECERDDNACKARRHERRAAAAATPEDRAYYLHLAHRSYLFSFDKSHDPADLCAARRNFDASLAIEGQTEKQRESTEAALKDLQARERAAQSGCRKQGQTPRRTRKPEPPRLVAEADALRRDPPVHAETVQGDSATPQAPPPDVAQVPAIPGRTPDNLSTAQDSVFPAPTSGGLVTTDALMPVPPRRASSRAGRGLVIAGGASLGVGLALAGVAGYMGGRTMDARRQAATLGGMVDGYADDAQLTQDQQLTREYEQRGTQTLALALAGGTTIVVAAVLLGVGGRRMARVATRTSLAPMPGGLVFRARF